MVNVYWTEKAEKRLQETYKHIAENSPFYGKQTVLNIVKRTKILETMPKIGRIVPEFNRDSVRELMHKNYRIIYKIVSENQIDISRVLAASLPACAERKYSKARAACRPSGLRVHCRR